MSPASPQKPNPIKVLVVDDSAVVRVAMPSVLSRDPGIEVKAAADPIIAMQKMKLSRPDVIILDLELPRMDGITFLRKIMREDPIPVVICSAHTGQGTELAIRALEEGAVEVITKPRLDVQGFLEESAVTIIDAVRAAASARLFRRRRSEPRRTADAMLPPLAKKPPRVTADKVVAIGASTGGTEALHYLLQTLPSDTPGIVIVQHMPEEFTRAFAARLDQDCAIQVKEAEHHDQVPAGRALIAPGNRHMLLTNSGSQYRVAVRDGPLVSRHRPSVDVLFRSVAQSAGDNAVGVIMTGMGDDGAEGLLEMKRAGASTIAQDEASCVVFGMPREAIARGAVDEVVSLSGIPSAILRRIRGQRA
jgi:two-component system chemotaxis response regulator CheB